VLQLHGHFNGAYASVPAGHVTPTGNTLTIVVDAATGEVTDADLTNTNTSTNLKALGTARGPERRLTASWRFSLVRWVRSE
jgi:hypothetical protein